MKVYICHFSKRIYFILKNTISKNNSTYILKLYKIYIKAFAKVITLNSDKISNDRFTVQHIYYEDTKVSELGGLDACVRDALNNTILKDGAFYGTFVAGIQYLMIGYRYSNAAYGAVILFGYNNSTERWNINNGEVIKA